MRDNGLFTNSRRNYSSKNSDTDNSLVITRGKGGWGELEEGMGESMVMGGGLTWGGSFSGDKDLSLLEGSPRGRSRKGQLLNPKDRRIRLREKKQGSMMLGENKTK